MLVEGMKTNPRQETMTKEQLMAFLKEHQFKLSEQDINSIINIVHHGDSDKAQKQQNDLSDTPVTFEAIKALINKENKQGN